MKLDSSLHPTTFDHNRGRLEKASKPNLKLQRKPPTPKKIKKLQSPYLFPERFSFQFNFSGFIFFQNFPINLIFFFLAGWGLWVVWINGYESLQQLQIMYNFFFLLKNFRSNLSKKKNEWQTRVEELDRIWKAITWSLV